MTLEVAIEVLHLLFGRIYEGNDLDRDKAIKLGIEALKKVKAVREGKEWVGINLLPGETKE